MTLFSGLGTDVHFSGDETGLQSGGRISLRVQSAVGWRMVMSIGQDERSQVHAMCVALQWHDEQSAH